MLANPPYGKNWKTDAEKMASDNKKKEILDTRFNAATADGEPLPMISRSSDGQLLFLLNNISKMKQDTLLGSRIVEVHNDSSLFTGDAVSRDEQYQNAMRNSDKQEARTESDRVLQKVIFSIMADNMELFKLFTDNQDFRKWLGDLVFNTTYNREGKPYSGRNAQ